MAKTYIASMLPPNEYTVLDTLVYAWKENQQQPIQLGWFKKEYLLLEDVTEPIADVLDRLRLANMAGQDFEGRWFPTQHGVDVAMFRTSTELNG